MFRLSVSKIPSTDEFKYRIRHKATGLEKVVSVSKCAMACNPSSINKEIAYQMSRRCTELMRELIHLTAGDDWRKYEARHAKQINKSILRAVKFAKYAITCKGLLSCFS